MSPWPISESSVVYQNRWITVREDQITRPDGESGIYGVVSLNQPAVFVVALTDEDEVALVEIDRHTVGSSLEVPAGGSDGQLVMEAAQRELLEEAGLVADDWRQLGRIGSLNGVCDAPGFIFLALGARPAEGADRSEQVAEGIKAVRMVPLLDVFELIRTGGITDAETIAAMMHAAVYLDRVL